MRGWRRTFVPYSRPWSETSPMLDVFTEESDRVRLVAKDIRSRYSTLKEALWPFTPFLLRFDGHGKIKTPRSAEVISLALPLNGITLYSGLYVNELLSRVLEYEMRSPELSFDYLRCAQPPAGVTDTPELALRRFKLTPLRHLGYGVNFTHRAGSDESTDDTMTYRHREEKGFITSVVIDNKMFIGGQLKTLNAREFPDADTSRTVKCFIRVVLKPYLGGKPLKSRELFRRFMPKRAVKIRYE